MPDRFFEDRKRGLEEHFFAEHNKKLLEKLREKREVSLKKAELSAASGITDEAMLERLIELDINSETLAALALVPLIEVAWADRDLADEERQAILAAARESGLNDDSSGLELLEGWLTRKPSAKMLAAWKDYVSALTENLDEEAKGQLRREVMGRCRSVAEAAGGILGLGNRVSSAERAVLDDLEQAFS